MVQVLNALNAVVGDVQVAQILVVLQAFKFGNPIALKGEQETNKS